MKGGFYIAILFALLCDATLSDETRQSEDVTELHVNSSGADLYDGYKEIHVDINEDKHITKEELRGKFAHEEAREIFSEGIHDEQASPQGASAKDTLSSSTFSTENHYFCSADEITDKQLILYGTKAWTFPQQDVNITLTYPAELASSLTMDLAKEVDFIITGFKVILYIDGVQTRGYITKGGILQDNITLTFINSSITSLLYKFWLYGIPKNTKNITELSLVYYMCS